MDSSWMVNGFRQERKPGNGTCMLFGHPKLLKLITKNLNYQLLDSTTQMDYFLSQPDIQEHL